MLFSKKKEVILDTNFLLLPGTLLIDIFTEINNIMKHPYRLVVYDKTLKELEGIIKKGKGKDVMAAKLALILIKQKNLKIKHSSSKTYLDDTIVKESDKNTIVATQDKELIRRLKEKRIPIIRLKQKKYLIIEGD